MAVKFGTDGWRGIVDEEVTVEGVEAVADAIASYLIETGTEAGGVVIGYDCRASSPMFAEAAAEVLTSRGIDVLFPCKYAPTPAVAYAVSAHKAGGAVMITASHNPPEYNGIKFIPHYGGPATSDITDRIERLLSSGRDSSPSIKGHRRSYDPQDGYLEHVCRLVGPVESGCPAIVDPLHGAARGYLDQALAGLGFIVITLHQGPDPTFGGRSPDPTPDNLRSLVQQVVERGARVGLGLDGDGDRLAACSSSGEIYTANRLLPLLYDHLVRTGGHSGGVARTVATTHLLDRLASTFGQPVIETPVGFKHVGPLLSRPDVLLAGEESGGLSIRGHILDKDAILGGLLIAAMISRDDGGLDGLWRCMVDRVGPAASLRLDLKYEPQNKDGLLASLATASEDSVRGVWDREVVACKRMDGLKVEYADGSWWLVRPSGTEPLIRCYVEAATSEQARTIADGLTSMLMDNPSSGTC